MNAMKNTSHFTLSSPPTSWERVGRILEKGPDGSYDANVTGDPCIVWDDEIDRYRMFYFAQQHGEDKEQNQTALAISKSATDVGPGDWIKQRPIKYINPELVGYDAHKAWVVMDPYRPNTPVRIEGKYWLFQAVYKGLNKVIMLATSESLDGPWLIQPEHVIDLGADDDIDAYNCDTPTAYWFEEREQILLFYKAYPKRPQLDQPGSPVGSGTAAAIMTPEDRVAKKLGRILPPSPEKGHWTSGWVSTPQLFKAEQGGWFGLLNGSPNPPAPVEEEPAMRESAPSQGGWIYTPEAWPVSGWQALEQPIEWIHDIPEEAQRQGEGVNMWRHHILVQPDGTLNLYYNSGAYGQERLYGKRTKIEISRKEPK